MGRREDFETPESVLLRKPDWMLAVGRKRRKRKTMDDEQAFDVIESRIKKENEGG